MLRSSSVWPLLPFLALLHPAERSEEGSSAHSDKQGARAVPTPSLHTHRVPHATNSTESWLGNSEISLILP
eukprot:5737885-Prymnesium_polylepis.1